MHLNEMTFVNSAAALTIGILCALASVIISGINIYGHLYHFRFPELQRPIIRIIIIVPVYAVGSMLSLSFRDGEPYFTIIRDMYEAFVVYSFLHLILEYIGGEGICVLKLHEKNTIAHPFPFCRLRRIPLNAMFVRRCKQYTLQFVIVKPIMAAISLILLATGDYDSTGYQVFSLLVYNISYTLALYALLLFYLATRDMLAGFHPVEKFFAVKSIVFATYWQSLAVELIPGAREESTAWNNFILCVEMVFFAVLHWVAFGYHEFKPGGSALNAAPAATVANTSSKAAKPVRIGSNKKFSIDNISSTDESESFSDEGLEEMQKNPMSKDKNRDGMLSHSARALVLSRAKNVLSVRDVMSEAFHNFHPSYQRYTSMATTSDIHPSQGHDSEANGSEDVDDSVAGSENLINIDSESQRSTDVVSTDGSKGVQTGTNADQHSNRPQNALGAMGRVNKKNQFHTQARNTDQTENTTDLFNTSTAPSVTASTDHEVAIEDQV